VVRKSGGLCCSQQAAFGWCPLVWVVGAFAGYMCWLLVWLLWAQLGLRCCCTIRERQPSDSICFRSLPWVRTSGQIMAAAEAGCNGTDAWKKGQVVQARTLCASVVVVYQQQACVLLPGCVCHVSSSVVVGMQSLSHVEAFHGGGDCTRARVVVYGFVRCISLHNIRACAL
jgi:hypothetical protein